jgi:Site-specific recombinases, DNA invertase Pin homologs
VLIGYARVSTTAQLLDRQLRTLDDAGCAKVFSDQLSGRDADRPELQACLVYLRAGDTLVVPHTVSSIARPLNVSRSTIYKYVLELTARQTIGPTPPSGGR